MPVSGAPLRLKTASRAARIALATVGPCKGPVGEPTLVRFTTHVKRGAVPSVRAVGWHGLAERLLLPRHVRIKRVLLGCCNGHAAPGKIRRASAVKGIRNPDAVFIRGALAVGLCQAFDSGGLPRCGALPVALVRAGAFALRDAAQRHCDQRRHGCATHAGRWRLKHAQGNPSGRATRISRVMYASGGARGTRDRTA